MGSDDLLAIVPHRRPLSPIPQDSLPLFDVDLTIETPPATKRRRLESEVDPTYEESFMVSANPMSRKRQRLQAKKERKATQRRSRDDMEAESEACEHPSVNFTFSVGGESGSSCH